MIRQWLYRVLIPIDWRRFGCTRFGVREADWMLRLDYLPLIAAALYAPSPLLALREQGANVTFPHGDV